MIFNSLITDEKDLADLLIGSAVHFDDRFLPRLEAGEVLPLNDGKYLLLELPNQSVPQTIKEVLFELRVRGYFPIFTDLERNQIIQKTRRSSVIGWSTGR